MKKNKKTVDDYMNLPYQINIVPHIEDGGVLYEAYIPELGRMAVRGDGKTIDEALQSLKDVKRFNFEQWLNDRVDIPEPEPERDGYNGKILVRTTKELHKQLVMEAKKNHVSLNSYINQLLMVNSNSYRTETLLNELNLKMSRIEELEHFRVG